MKSAALHKEVKNKCRKQTNITAYRGYVAKGEHLKKILFSFLLKMLCQTATMAIEGKSGQLKFYITVIPSPSSIVQALRLKWQ